MILISHRKLFFNKILVELVSLTEKCYDGMFCFFSSSNINLSYSNTFLGNFSKAQEHTGHIASYKVQGLMFQVCILHQSQSDVCCIKMFVLALYS